MNDHARLPRGGIARRAVSKRRQAEQKGPTRTSGRRPAPAHHYYAFLSYSHADEEMADWLHNALEEFRVPRRLVGQLTENGSIPRRLTPIFRDRGELAASNDLSEDIEDALAGSRFLIVLCSRSAVSSRWANKEIETFKRFHPEGCILAAIVDGEPFASETAGREAEECFPQALRVRYDQRGRPTTKRADPIAADLREGRDGRHTGVLKIIAGMLGVRLDELVQRETHRRQRRLAFLTAASIAGMAVTSGLAYTAIESRDAARDQRREAESLIGFMLGDLRQKLEPLGKLEVLDGVGERALAYYEKQDKTELSDLALAQRSKALTLMGEIAELEGDIDGALRNYREAMAGTAEAVRREPDNADRIFEHAQNVYWVGSIAMQRGNTADAERQFEEYNRLADRLVRSDPKNPKWRLEKAYATTNLGSVLIEQRLYSRAVKSFEASIDAGEALTSLQPDNGAFQKQLIEAVAWHAEAAEKSGDLPLATAGRERQVRLLQPFVSVAKPEPDFQQKAMIAHMALARHIYEGGGGGQSALRHSAAAARIGETLNSHDPENADWMGRSANAQLNHALVLLRTGNSEESRVYAQKGCDLVTRALARDRTVASWQATNRSCLSLKAELALANGLRDEAALHARQMLLSARSDQGGDSADKRFALVTAYKVLGDVTWQSGNREAALSAWRAGLNAIPKGVALTPRQMREKSDMLIRTGSTREGRRLSSQLSAMGFRNWLHARPGY